MTDDPNKTGMWQPIETAGKEDCVELLMYRPQYVCEIAIGYWSEQEQGWRAIGCETPYQQPTHWMPLPAPPSQTSIQPPPAAVGPREEESHAEHWTVSVEVDGENVLTISSQHLAGATDVDRHAATVRHCAEHLLAFIGAAPSVELQDDLSQRLRRIMGWFPAASENRKCIHDAADRIDALQAVVDRHEQALAILYTKVSPLAVADVCDDLIDKSGALLGRVREAARRLAKAPQNG